MREVFVVLSAGGEQVVGRVLLTEARSVGEGGQVAVVAMSTGFEFESLPRLSTTERKEKNYGASNRHKLAFGVSVLPVLTKNPSILK